MLDYPIPENSLRITREFQSKIELPARGWRPKPYQIPIWDALWRGKYKKYAIVMHRQAGKDELALHHLALRILTTKDGRFLYLFPQQNQAKLIMWDTGRWKSAFPPELIPHLKIRENSMSVAFPNGSILYFRGSDNYDSLVGLTLDHIVYSEAALTEPEAFSRLSPTLLVRNGTSVYITTPRGKNHFYELFKTFENDPTVYTTILDVNKTKAVPPEILEREKKTLGLSYYKQEYECSFENVQDGAVFGAQLEELEKSERIGGYGFDPNYPVITTWDLGVKDDTVVLFFQCRDDKIILIDWLAGNDVGYKYYADRIKELPYNITYHFVPHDIKQREQSTGMSKLDAAREYGLFFTPIPITAKSEQIRAGSELLRQVYFKVNKGTGFYPTLEQYDNSVKNSVNPDVSQIIEHLKNYVVEYKSRLGTYSETPKHNKASHYADAFMLAALAKRVYPQAFESRVLQGRNPMGIGFGFGGTSPDLEVKRVRGLKCRTL